MTAGNAREDGAVTSHLAEMCASFDYESIPERAKEQTKLLLVDTIGVMLAASNPELPGTRHIMDMARSECEGSCVVVGSDFKTHPSMAALVNGYLGYAFDSDALYRPAIMHGGAAILPAVLAVMRPNSVPGSQLLAALTLGVEVACRVSQALGPSDLYARGYHPTAVGGAFGAAVAAGSLLSFDGPSMEKALGLAAAQASGLLAWTSDTTEQSRPFTSGLAARNGVTAANLAATGFGAPAAVFDPGAKYNAFRTWSADGEGSPHHLTRPLGLCEATQNLVFKLHGCCGFLHPAVDLLLEIMSSEGLGKADIEHIAMRFPSRGAAVIDNNRLRSHSAQYILPLAATTGRVDFEDVLLDRLHEEKGEVPRPLTSVVYDTELDADFPALRTTVLEVTVVGGKTFRQRLASPRGTPENPLAHEELYDKFRLMSTRRLDQRTGDELLESLLHLEEAADAWEALELVCMC